MKKLNISLSMKKMIAPLVLLFFFLALTINVNAQEISNNGITPPSVVTSVGAFNPGTLVGTTVTVTDAGGSTCPNVVYEWQSASDQRFLENLTTNLASTKDYNPGTVTATTYFRRVVTIDCTDPERSLISNTPGIKITIN
jgi:hypothetical protein